MTNHQREVAYHIERIAASMRAKADDLEAYATALLNDPSFTPRLAAPFGAPAAVVQITNEVAERNKPVDTYQLNMALLEAVTHAQRDAGA